jgi:hypothetical protein
VLLALAHRLSYLLRGCIDSLRCYSGLLAPHRAPTVRGFHFWQSVVSTSACGAAADTKDASRSACGSAGDTKDALLTPRVTPRKVPAPQPLTPTTPRKTHFYKRARAQRAGGLHLRSCVRAYVRGAKTPGPWCRWCQCLCRKGLCWCQLVSVPAAQGFLCSGPRCQHRQGQPGRHT